MLFYQATPNKLSLSKYVLLYFLAIGNSEFSNIQPTIHGAVNIKKIIIIIIIIYWREIERKRGKGDGREERKTKFFFILFDCLVD